MTVTKRCLMRLIMTLEYANTAWTPILRRDQILLENVQRRAMKLIPELRDRDYEDRLRALKLPSLPKSTWRHDRGLQMHTQHIQNRAGATTTRV